MVNKNNNFGFTLIELVVVVASVGLIMTSVVGMILGTFKAQDRTKTNNKIIENSTWIVSQLRKNVLNSLSEDITCSADNLSIQIINSGDKKTTTLSCNKSGNKIASNSAVLNNNEVNVTDCGSFAVCQLDSAGKVVNVVFNFGIGTTTGGVSSNQNFTTTITVRD